LKFFCPLYTGAVFRYDKNMIGRLKKLRKLLGLQQTAFAGGVGLTQGHYSMIERGEVELTDRNIMLICSVYHVNEQWLRTGKGSIFSVQEARTRTGEKTVFDMYDKLLPEAREFVKKMITDLWELQELKKRVEGGE
jgi:transcriptional regulator with XRE-family HTH domain